MSIEKKATRVLETARELATKAPTWADFSLELFDQHSGLVAKTFPGDMERQAFFDTPQYEEINGLLDGLMRKTGVASGAHPTAAEKSGRFNVRVPKSLHKSLEIEAKREGVSLNQLAIAKLAVPLRNSAKVALQPLVQAFGDVHEGYAIDRIVADPDYNGKFLRRCRELKLTESDFELNKTLLSLRKSKKQRERLGIVLPATTKKTEFRDFDAYQYASEIAVRVLQRTDGVTLDTILCDPKLAVRFDDIALSLVNETVLKLRWAAFNLRKTHNLKPIDPSVTDYDLVSAGPVQSIDLSSLSDLPGLYVFYDGDRPLYAGETDRLNDRITKHLKYGLPCADLHDESVSLRTSVLPNAKHSERVRWLMQFVNRERPLLNYQDAA